MRSFFLVGEIRAQAKTASRLGTCGRRGVATSAACAALLLVACSPRVAVFQCADSSQCGPDGLCQPSGYCSFPDVECESGWRYSRHAGGALADSCAEGTGGAGSVDGGETTDSRPRDADACQDWLPAPVHVNHCALPAPFGALVLDAGSFEDPTWHLDTDTGELINPEGQLVPVANGLVGQTNGPQLRVLSVTDLDIGVGCSLVARGSRPLLIASFGQIVISGLLDVSSDRDQVATGAGANPMACTDHGGTGVTGGPIWAGGGGGAFGGAGGDGGASNGTPTAQGGAELIADFGVVRGGCAGGNGHGTDAAGATGGAGGGAIQLTAREGIVISGQVDAGGAGGERARVLAQNEGWSGAGGGSGGYIGLDAPDVMVTGHLTARGGGGGGGAKLAAPGEHGTDGKVATRGFGGLSGGGCDVGDGGDGSWDSTSAGANGIAGYFNPATPAASCTSGAGGGGHGVISSWANTLGGDGLIDPVPHHL